MSENASTVSAITPVPKTPNPKKKFIICGCIVALAVIVIVIVAIVATGGKKLDVSKYYHIEVTGLNGMAKAEVLPNASEETSNYAAIVKDLELEVNTPMALDTFGKFCETIKFTLDKSEDISNSDNLVATATFDEMLAENYKIKLDNNTIKTTVSGLIDGKVIDIFEDIELEYTGISPFGVPKIVNNSSDDFVKKMGFTIEPEINVKNGDIVKVKTNCMPQYAFDNNLIMKETEKEYTVSGLPKYIDTVSDITDTVKEQLNSDAKDILDAAMALSNMLGTTNTYSDIVQISQTLITAKDITEMNLSRGEEMLSTFDTYNSIITIYQMEVANSIRHDVNTMYVGIPAKNVSVNAQGEISAYYEDTGSISFSRSKDKVTDRYIDSTKAKFTIQEIQ